MPVLTKENLRDQLKRGEIAPVYVLFGPEINLRDVAARYIANLCFGPNDLRDFNESEFSLNGDGNLQRGLAAANQLPMMAARRLIRVTDVRISASGHRDTILEEHEHMLQEYFDNPCVSSVLLFIADDLNGVRRMGKLLRAQTIAVEFKALSDEEALAWAGTVSRRAEVQIDAAALRHFAALVGNDSARIENEVEKLATAALPSKSVSIELIDQLVPNSRELTNFVLTDTLVGRQKSASIAILRKLLRDGAEPLMILGLISYNFRRLLTAKEMMSRGADRGDVTRTLNLRGRDQEGFLASARRAEADALRTAIRLIADTDLAIKTSVGGSGPAGGRLLIEMLIAELCTL
jgi:DNA polymerase III subunit delta